jgi:hypothetical protein
VSQAVKSPSTGSLAIQASSARAAFAYARIVSSSNGRFYLFVRDRSHSSNSVIIIVRSCCRRVPVARCLVNDGCWIVATRSGDLRGLPAGADRLVD